MAMSCQLHKGLNKRCSVVTVSSGATLPCRGTLSSTTEIESQGASGNVLRRLGTSARVAPCIVQVSPRQVAAQLEEPESEEVEDDLDAELEDVHVCVAEMDQDVSAEGDEDDEEEEEAEKCEHKGIIGAVAVSGRQSEPSEFFIRYPKETCGSAGLNMHIS